jgi:hypothetical protein
MEGGNCAKVGQEEEGGEEGRGRSRSRGPEVQFKRDFNAIFDRKSDDEEETMHANPGKTLFFSLTKAGESVKWVQFESGQKGDFRGREKIHFRSPLTRIALIQPIQSSF